MKRFKKHRWVNFDKKRIHGVYKTQYKCVDCEAVTTGLNKKQLPKRGCLCKKNWMWRNHELKMN